MNYLSRITHPTSFSEAAQAFDRLVKDTFCQRLKLPAFTDVAHAQLQLPVRLGGFGLSAAQIVSPIAWYCSFAQAYSSVAPLVLPRFPEYLDQFPKGSAVASSPVEFLNKFEWKGFSHSGSHWKLLLMGFLEDTVIEFAFLVCRLLTLVRG